MWIDEYKDELYHHGVKGMKWGVRKASVREMRKEKKRVHDEEYKRLRESYGTDKLREEVWAYGQKHNLDMDDGGGGDPKAGREYMKKWSKIEQLEQRAETRAGKKAADHILKTYGEKGVKKLKRADNARTAAIIATLPINLALAPITVPAMGIANAVKAKRAAKKEQT